MVSTEELWLRYPEERQSLSDLHKAMQSGTTAPAPREGRHQLLNLLEEEIALAQRGASVLEGPTLKTRPSTDRKTRLDELVQKAKSQCDGESDPSSGRFRPKSHDYAPPSFDQLVQQDFVEFQMPSVETIKLEHDVEAEKRDRAEGLELGTPQDRLARRGEWIVYQYLQKELKASAGQVVWVNEHGEQGEPFDLMVLDQHSAVQSYIEVKTSSRSDKKTFEVSRKEMEFALHAGRKYTLYRVAMGYAKTSGIATLTKIEHLSHHFGKSLTLLVYVGGSDGSGPDSAGTASGPEANLKGHVTGQSQILSGPQAVSDTGTGRDSDSGPGPAAGSGSPT